MVWGPRDSGGGKRKLSFRLAYRGGVGERGRGRTRNGSSYRAKDSGVEAQEGDLVSFNRTVVWWKGVSWWSVPGWRGGEEQLENWRVNITAERAGKEKRFCAWDDATVVDSVLPRRI